MKTLKSLITLLLLFGIASLLWKGFISNKKALLIEIATPLNDACQSESGCIKNPEGWKISSKGTSYKDHKIYMVKNDTFQINWKIITGVTLLANGGKSQELTIVQIYD